MHGCFGYLNSCISFFFSIIYEHVYVHFLWGKAPIIFTRFVEWFLDPSKGTNYDTNSWHHWKTWNCSFDIHLAKPEPLPSTKMAGATSHVAPHAARAAGPHHFPPPSHSWPRKDSAPAAPPLFRAGLQPESRHLAWISRYGGGRGGEGRVESRRPQGRGSRPGLSGARPWA